jgi:hypothetical protein
MGGDGADDRIIPITHDMDIDLPAGSPLRQLADRPALVILLRSFGCTFCREAMADVAAAKEKIRGAGAQIAFVHGGTPSEAAPWFHRFGLDDVVTISDPDLAHYRAFGLARTSAAALVDPTVWTRGAVCAVSYGFGAQTLTMMRQLPGVFLVQGERVISAYRHRSPADRPDYLALVRYADNALQ